MKEDDFAEAYRSQREQLVDEVVAGLQRIGAKSVAVLDGAMDDEDANTRVRAARYVLDFIFKVSEIAELKREVEEIRAYDREHFGERRPFR